MTGDFHIEDHGTVWLFQPLSEAAKTFLEEEVESGPWQWLGDFLYVDRRPAIALREVLIDEGFSLV